ncbi:MAG TPA: hypothetical protein VJH95_03675 [Candidatus Nanoarchaeia archaeon]|nr:hypothetical protein [Candidatus Nanoarchaeia archaeon]
MRNWLLKAGLACFVSIGCADEAAPPTILKVVEGSGSTYSIAPECGERELHTLARHAALEDLWVRYDKQWIDVGINQELGKLEVDTNLVHTFTDTLPRGSVLHEYHIHPGGAQHDLFAPPSINDIITHAYQQKGLRGKGVALVSRVSDGHGMWEYAVTPELEEEIINGVDRRITLLELWLKIEKGEPLLGNPRQPTEKDFSGYLQYMKSKGVLLSYTPFGEEK